MLVICVNYKSGVKPSSNLTEVGKVKSFFQRNWQKVKISGLGALTLFAVACSENENSGHFGGRMTDSIGTRTKNLMEYNNNFEYLVGLPKVYADSNLSYARSYINTAKLHAKEYSDDFFRGGEYTNNMYEGLIMGNLRAADYHLNKLDSILRVNLVLERDTITVRDTLVKTKIKKVPATTVSFDVDRIIFEKDSTKTEAEASASGNIQIRNLAVPPAVQTADSSKKK